MFYKLLLINFWGELRVCSAVLISSGLESGLPVSMSPPLTGNATQGNKFIWKTAARDLGPTQLSMKAGMCDSCLPNGQSSSHAIIFSYFPKRCKPHWTCKKVQLVCFVWKTDLTHPPNQVKAWTLLQHRMSHSQGPRQRHCNQCWGLEWTFLKKKNNVLTVKRGLEFQRRLNNTL